MLIISFGVLSGSSQSIRTATIIPSDDAYVDSDNEDINYKNADLKVRFWNLSFLTDLFQISYLAFDVELPSDINITEIALKITVKFMPFDGHTVHIIIHETDVFSEDTLTYANRPPLFNIVGGGNIDLKDTWTFPLNTQLFLPNASYYIALTTDTDHVSGIIFEFPRLEIIYTTSQELPSIPPQILLIVAIPIIILIVVGYTLRKKKKPDQPVQYNTTRVLPRFCNNCGQRLDLGTNICTNCGNKIL